MSVPIMEPRDPPISQRLGNQDPGELAQFLNLACSIKAKRYLEIGCRHGYTFYAVMHAMGLGSYGLALDLGDVAPSLALTINELQSEGHHAELVIGSSQDVVNMNYARDRAPFDLILIDADHRYEGVRSDWFNYHDLAKVVALHDIACPENWLSDSYPCGVPRLWNEIKGSFRYEEYVTGGSKMGFGVVFQ